MTKQSKFGFVDIISCKDPLMWYCNKVGKRIPLIKPYWLDKENFLCREDSGLLNIVKKTDAVYIK